MSMNLYFKVRGAPTFVKVDFPWQTPTKVTHAVINASTLEERLKILRESISYWEDDMIERKIKEAEQLLTSDTLELEFW